MQAFWPVKPGEIEAPACCPLRAPEPAKPAGSRRSGLARVKNSG